MGEIAQDLLEQGLDQIFYDEENYPIGSYLGPDTYIGDEPPMAQVQRQSPRPAGANTPQRRGPPVAARPNAAAQKPSAQEIDPDRAIRAFLYGPEGVGKTSMVANSPKPGFFHDPKERGIHTLIKFRQCPKPAVIKQVDSYTNILDECKRIAQGKYDIENACFDSATGFEHLVFREHCEKNFEGNWTKDGFFAYQQGPKNAAKTDVPELLEAFDEIAQAGINVWLLGHSQIKTFSNPEGADYDRYIPYLDKETWQQIKKWAQAVIFYTYKVDLDKKGLKKKATGESRQINTQRTPAYDAKNWWGMESYIDAGDSGKEAWEAFDAAYQAAAAGR